jgi:hypothetical protein
MKESMQFASITGIVNTVVLNMCNWMSTTPEAHQLASNVAQALSPFAALCVMKIYAKIDHPPALVRKEAALAAAIKFCKKHLNDNYATEEFKIKTRTHLAELMLQQQKVRVDFEQNNTYSSSLPSQEKSAAD